MAGKKKSVIASLDLKNYKAKYTDPYGNGGAKEIGTDNFVLEGMELGGEASVEKKSSEPKKNIKAAAPAEEKPPSIEKKKIKAAAPAEKQSPSIEQKKIKETASAEVKPPSIEQKKIKAAAPAVEAAAPVKSPSIEKKKIKAAAPAEVKSPSIEQKNSSAQKISSPPKQTEAPSKKILKETASAVEAAAPVKSPSIEKVSDRKVSSDQKISDRKVSEEASKGEKQSKKKNRKKNLREPIKVSVRSEVKERPIGGFVRTEEVEPEKKKPHYRRVENYGIVISALALVYSVYTADKALFYLALSLFTYLVRPMVGSLFGKHNQTVQNAMKGFSIAVFFGAIFFIFY